MASSRPPTASPFFRLGSLAVTLLALYLGSRMPERRGLDYLLALRGSLDASHSPVTLVAIDSPSLQKLGRWPWDRRIHARLVRRLKAAGARVIAFDVFFGQHAQNDPAQDEVFALACKEAGNVVLGSYLADPLGGRQARPVALEPIPCLRDAAAGLGLLYHPFDEDGAIRRAQPLIKLGKRFHPSLDLTCLLLHLNIPFEGVETVGREAIRIPRKGFGDLRMPLDEETATPIDFRGAGGTFRRISYQKALDEPLPPEIREGIVLVGHVDKTLQDRYLTTVSTRDGTGRMRMAGVEIHANTIDAFLDGRFYRGLGLWSEVSLLAGLAVLAATALYRIRPQRSWIVILLMALSYPALAYLLLQEKRLILPVFRPLWTLLFLYLGTLLFRYFGLEWIKNLEIRKQHARLEAIYATSEVVTATQRGESFNSTVGAFLAALSSLHRHALWFLDDGGIPELRASAGMTKEELSELGPSVSKALEGWKERNGPSPHLESCPLSPEGSTAPSLLVPLRSRGNVVGAMLAQADDDEGGDQGFEAFLHSLAALIGQTADLSATLEDLRESQRYGELLLSAMTTGVALFDTMGILLATNEAFRRMLAPLSIEVGVLAPIVLQGKAPLLELLHATMAEGPQSPRELALETEGRSRVFLGRSEVFRDEAGERNALMLFLDEVTELRRLTEQLHRADKLASLGQFAAGVVHEIKNPLTVIRTSAELLQREVEGSKRGPKLVNYIIKDADRLNDLAMDILRFSKPERGKAEACDLKKLLDGLLSIVRPDLSKARISAFLEGDEDLPPIWADRAGLQQVFMNLFNNSRDALDEGGSLRICCRRSAASTVEVEFADDGPGFPPEALEKIFEPYFTSKGDKGTGLGLSIVLKILERQGGEVEADNLPEGGARLRLRWPQHLPAAEINGDDC